MAYTTIDDPSAYFQTVIWTGDGNDDRSITFGGNSDMQPDMVWTKRRPTASSHGIRDSSRGAAVELFPGSSDDELSVSDRFQAFESDGFQIGTNGDINHASSNNTYVAWAWKANGGTRTTNTESGANPGGGYQANTTAGFSIIDYTGTGSAGTMAHGLGAVPECFIVKGRNIGGSWRMYHHKMASDPETDSIKLDETGAKADVAGHWNDTAPTSSVFSIGDDDNTNNDGNTYICYAWKEIQGYSKFGGYEGNNNSDGPFLYTGFQPAFFMVKNVDATSAWRLYSNKISNQNGFNDVDRHLYPNSSEEEGGGGHVVDFLSNGIKIRGDNEDVNDANTYIYMAFAEHPFVSSKGVPCTAR